MKSYQYFAANAWHDPSTGSYFESENPATGEVWAKLPDCNAEDVNRAVAAARSAYCDGPWGKLHPAERGRVLRRIGDTISRHAERLGEVDIRDNGRVPSATSSLQPGAWQVDSFHYYAGMCDKFEGRVIPAEVPDMHNFVTFEPFGVVAQILPWNSPLGTLIWKLAPCLAAGNTVVIKPSEQASCSVLELMDVLLEADLPPGVLNVVTGFGATTGEPLIDHPDVRLVSFTGGTAGGRAAAAVAARQVKPVIMELGGKSPQVVLPDADLDLAVNGIVWSVLSKRQEWATRMTQRPRSALWPTGRSTSGCFSVLPMLILRDIGCYSMGVQVVGIQAITLAPPSFRMCLMIQTLPSMKCLVLWSRLRHGIPKKKLSGRRMQRCMASQRGFGQAMSLGQCAWQSRLKRARCISIIISMPLHKVRWVGSNNLDTVARMVGKECVATCRPARCGSQRIRISPTPSQTETGKCQWRFVPN